MVGLDQWYPVLSLKCQILGAGTFPVVQNHVGKMYGLIYSGKSLNPPLLKLKLIFILEFLQLNFIGHFNIMGLIQTSVILNTSVL